MFICAYPFEHQDYFVCDAMHHTVTSTMRLCRITIMSAAVLQWYKDDLWSSQHAAAQPHQIYIGTQRDIDHDIPFCTMMLSSKLNKPIGIVMTNTMIYPMLRT